MFYCYFNPFSFRTSVIFLLLGDGVGTAQLLTMETQSSCKRALIMISWSCSLELCWRCSPHCATAKTEIRTKTTTASECFPQNKIGIGTENAKKKRIRGKQSSIGNPPSSRWRCDDDDDDAEHITRCSLHSICLSMLRNPFCKDTSYCVCAVWCVSERIVLQGSESRTAYLRPVRSCQASFQGIPGGSWRRSKDAQRITILGGGSDAALFVVTM